MKIIQQQLNLFPAPGFEELIAHAGSHDLTVTFNNRLKTSWKLITGRDGKRRMIIPAILQHAPEEIKRAIISWALLKKPFLKKNRREYYIVKKQLEQSVWNYLSSQGVTPRRKVIRNPNKLLESTRGVRYDLQVIFDAINREYFNNALCSYVRWGATGSKISYQSPHTDTKGAPCSLITIAGAYNHPDVPEYAIRGVMFHEMLHIAQPPYKKNGRRVIHGREYRKAQDAFPELDRWLLWEKKHMHEIIASLRKKTKKRFSWLKNPWKI